jgi:hypothetical protein
VGESGEREALAQSLADTAAVADNQRAHLRAFFAGEVGVDKAADPRAYRGDLRSRKLASVTDYRKALALARAQHHRRGDSLAREVSSVVELAGVAEVARKAQRACHPHLVADANRRRRAHNRQANRAA